MFGDFMDSGFVLAVVAGAGFGGDTVISRLLGGPRRMPIQVSEFSMFSRRECIAVMPDPA